MRVAFALLLIAVAVPARGDETIARVRKLYDSGMTHYNLGEYKDALADFTEAYRLKHDAAFLFNIGQAHRQLGEPEEAAREYRAYLREAPDTPNRREVEKFIHDADAQVSARHAAQPPTGIVKPESVKTEGTVTATPETAPAAPSEKAGPATENPRPPSRTWLWVTISVVAVVAIAVGVGLGVGLSQGTSEPSTRFGTFGVFQ